MKKYWLAIFLLLSLFCSDIWGQNYLADAKVTEAKEKIAISLRGQNTFDYEIIPFDSRKYTLMKFSPLQFNETTKEQLLTQLKSLSVQVQAIELLDQTIMLTFKGIEPEQLQVRSLQDSNQIDIEVLPKLAQQQKPTRLKSADEYLEAAEKYLQENKFADALTEIHRLLRLKPACAAAYFLAGKIRFKQERWQMAEINFTKAKSLDPELEVKPFLTKIEHILNPASALSAKIHSGEETGQLIQKQVEGNVVEKSAAEGVERNNLTNTDSTFNGTSDSNAVHSQIKPAPNEPKKTNDSISSVPQTIYESSALGRNYAQLGLFGVIIAIVSGWLILLWKKRKEFSQLQQQTAVDFTKLLQNAQNSPELNGQPTPENRAASRQEKAVPLQEAGSSPLPPYVGVGFQSDSIWQHPNKKTQSRFHYDEPTSPGGRCQNLSGNSPANREQLEEQIFHYAAMGYSVEEIAERFQLGKVEVELMLNFNGKRRPMSAPGVRIEMDVL